MKKLALLFALGLAMSNAPAQNLDPTPAAKPAATTGSLSRAAQMQADLDRLTQTNRDLLDLLKKQQAVLEDLQFDRRLQSRRIEALEVHLEETMMQNAELQAKIARLETAAALPARSPDGAPATGTLSAVAPSIVPLAPGPVVETPLPPPPSTYLPPPEMEGAPGTKSWHRLFTLKGMDGQNSQFFHVQGRSWRVLWHNLDKPGKSYQNTSALFVSAFPKNDTIPQNVCSKLGTGGDASELVGPGTYYLKIEASGGSWELAVEDFR